MRNLRNHVTYANVVSTLALAIALGMGSAYAANQLAPKSVGARQLRPGAVTADKIRKKAVTAPKLESLAVKQGKIAAGAVVTSKLADGAVTTAKIATGAVAADKIPNDSLTGTQINESTLGRVPTANTADFATTAETANPEAFAKVDVEGTVFPAFSKGIATTDVKQGPEPGVYCIGVPGFVPRGAQVTPEYRDSNTVTAYVNLAGSAACGSQVEVQTFAAGTHQKEPFFILFYR